MEEFVCVFICVKEQTSTEFKQIGQNFTNVFKNAQKDLLLFKNNFCAQGRKNIVNDY